MAISVPPFLATDPAVYEHLMGRWAAGWQAHSDTGSVLDESIRALRDYMKARPLVWANGQAALWRKTGFVDVIEVPIVLSFDYASFEDYWSSWSTGPTRIAQRLQELPIVLRAEIERHVCALYLAG